MADSFGRRADEIGAGVRGRDLRGAARGCAACSSDAVARSGLLSDWPVKHPQPCTSRSSRTRTPSPDGGAARLGLLVGCGGVRWSVWRHGHGAALCGRPTAGRAGLPRRLHLCCVHAWLRFRSANASSQRKIPSLGRKPNHSCEELASQMTAEAQNADMERLMDQKLERINVLAHIAARIVSSPNSTSGNVPRAPKRQGAGQQNMLYLGSTLDAATYVH
ncbi:hypothetical protein EJB05_02572, partial [Eragrostis curvula]